MPPHNFKCTRCGYCCTKISGGYSFSPDTDDLELWEKEAPHILDWVCQVGFEFYDAWISPVTREEVGRCPWYRFYKHSRYKQKGAACLIQNYKPRVCREFPWHIQHAKLTGCPGFNHLSGQEQLAEMRAALLNALRHYAEHRQIPGWEEKEEQYRREMRTAVNLIALKLKA